MSRYDTITCAILPQSALRFTDEDIQGRTGEATMNTNKAAEQNRNSKRQGSDLDLRYGKIGISAVAAAVRYRD
jgi:hypothetical protein